MRIYLLLIAGILLYCRSETATDTYSENITASEEEERHPTTTTSIAINNTVSVEQTGWIDTNNSSRNVNYTTEKPLTSQSVTGNKNTTDIDTLAIWSSTEETEDIPSIYCDKNDQTDICMGGFCELNGTACQIPKHPSK